MNATESGGPYYRAHMRPWDTLWENWGEISESIKELEAAMAVSPEPLARSCSLLVSSIGVLNERQSTCFGALPELAQWRLDRLRPSFNKKDEIRHRSTFKLLHFLETLGSAT